VLMLSCSSAFAFEYIKEYDESQYDWLLDTTPVEIEIYYSNSDVFDDENSLAVQRIAEKTGVTISRTSSGDSDGTGLMLRLASNDLPDIILFGGSAVYADSFMQQAIATDSIWAYDDLIEQYAPNFKVHVPEYYFTDFQWEDGKTYQIKNCLYDEIYYNAMLEYGAIDQQNCTLIRKDWYEEVGSPDVSTPDGFIACIKAIMEKHPEAYGWCTPDLKNGYPYGEFAGQFGVPNYYVLEDGTVTDKAFSPEAREAALFANRLYREGLLRKDNMIEGGDECQAYVFAGKTVAYRWNTEEHGKKVDNGGEDAWYMALPPFETYKSYMTYSMSGTNIIISKNCEHPDRAVRLIEYMFSQEGQKDLFWGIQGETPENGGTWSGDYVNGPHWFIEEDSGKPTYYEGYTAALGSDWSGTIAKSGLKDVCISETLLGFRQLRWQKGTEKFDRMLEQYEGKVVMAPEFSGISVPSSDEDLQEIKNEVNTIMKNYTATIVYAETEEEANAAYDQMLADVTDAGIEKLNAVYTEQYNANVAAYK